DTGAQVFFSLPKKAENVTLEVFDINGASVSKTTGPTGAGLHHSTWDLGVGPARPAGEGAGRFGQRGGGQRGGGQRAAGQRGGGQPGAEPQAGGEGGESGPRGGGGGFGGGQGLRRPVPAGTYR